ncbi:MAG: S46 family peptidase [Bacteroidota bacterium]
MKKSTLLVLFFIIVRITGFAEEGMWVPMLVEQLNVKKMQDLGLRLSAEDIYSVNHSSLKDAIVQFGGGCTAEIVSEKGLIFTNYHCGLGAIQRLSSLDRDYITNGFWAKSNQQELPCPGTTVTLLVRMEDVTLKTLTGVTADMNEMQRNQIIRQNIEQIEKETEKGTHFVAKVRPFYYGNQYYLFVNEVFKDVRLVGAPPVGIGKFGGDTDNWMWPRHTGDFAVFRIYANANNEPAAWSKDNIPYKPKSFLPISLKGYEKNDFTFVFGYPGTTREYLSSCGVDLIANKENPLRISLRQKRLDIMNAAMDESPLVRIQYMAKVNGIANYWKKMIGESRGIRRFDAIAKKEVAEHQFQLQADSNERWKVNYSGLQDAFKTAYEQYQPLDLSSIYITEAAQGIEIIRFAAGFRELSKISKDKLTTPAAIGRALENMRLLTRDFYKNWQPSIDQKIMAVALQEMSDKMDNQYKPEIISEISIRYKNDFSQYSNEVFPASLFTDSTRLLRFLNGYKPSHCKKLDKDPVFSMMQGIYTWHEKNILPGVNRLMVRIDSIQRLYMAALMEMQAGKALYPDANGTLRIAYGKVNDYEPADAVKYNYYTTLSGVMQKEDSTIYDYKVDTNLKKLYLSNDFGNYADRDGTMHVAFTASNHTTGGNSGSPVLNGDGQMIGINFDRNWEGTLSDLMYDPSQCRNISLDIRYCLFIIDKVYGASRLIDEMKIVN